MKLVLLRNQSSTLTGKILFSITANVEVSDEELADIKKFKIGKTLLYTNMDNRGSGILGAISRASMEVKFTINDLIEGKKIECKDILEVLELEQIIIDTCKTFDQILKATKSFGGQEVIEI